jgi:hypothetical protein
MYDYTWLKKHVVPSSRNVSRYRKYGDQLPTSRGQLIHQDNSGSILFVGHLDTVLWGKPEWGERSVESCPQLDDRLGVAMILERIPDIVTEPYDVLLCDLEEQCDSTARYFDLGGRYRWVVEFDRAGSDAVLYQYTGGELQRSLVDCGIDVSRGSYSDIAELDRLGCECVNFGCGYHGQHTANCYASYAEIESQLAKFANWYAFYGNESFPYVKPEPKKLRRKDRVTQGSLADQYDYEFTKMKQAWKF